MRVTTLDADGARAAGIEPLRGVVAGIRVVEAEGFDRQPCGGTHPATTAEVGVVLILAPERYQGGMRVRFVCGDRALDAVARRQGILAELTGVLS